MRTYKNTTNTKIIVSGSTLEVFSYSFGLNYGSFEDGYFEDFGRFDTAKVGHNIDKEVIVKARLSHTQKTAVRLIDSNCYAYRKSATELYPPVMLTLTTKENISDLRVTNPMLLRFVKRFNYDVLKGDKRAYLKYVAVPEWQERGAVHYHIALFNLPYIPQRRLERIWGEGYVWINRADKIKSLGRYMSKYMTKGFADSRFEGHKRYMPSVGLFRPTVVLDNQQAVAIKNILPKSKCRKEWTYYSQWQGEVVHQEYDLGRGAEYNELTEGINSILTTAPEVVEW